jgi:hypothetical protein
VLRNDNRCGSIIGLSLTRGHYIGLALKRVPHQWRCAFIQANGIALASFIAARCEWWLKEVEAAGCASGRDRGRRRYRRFPTYRWSPILIPSRYRYRYWWSLRIATGYSLNRSRVIDPLKHCW